MCCSEFDHEISYNKFKSLIYDLQFDIKDHKNRFVSKIGHFYIKAKAAHTFKHKSEFSLEEFLRRYTLDD